MADADGDHLTLQLQRDAPLGSDLPAFATNSTTYNASIPLQNQTIFWNPLPDGENWDGFALLVDDVERYVGSALNYSLAALQPGIIHFFRLAVSFIPSPGLSVTKLICVSERSSPAAEQPGISPWQPLCIRTAHG